VCATAAPTGRAIPLASHGKVDYLVGVRGGTPGFDLGGPDLRYAAWEAEMAQIRSKVVWFLGG